MAASSVRRAPSLWLPQSAPRPCLGMKARHQGWEGKFNVQAGGMRALVKNGAQEQPGQPRLLCPGTPPGCQPAGAVESRADGQKSTQVCCGLDLFSLPFPHSVTWAFILYRFLFLKHLSSGAEKPVWYQVLASYWKTPVLPIDECLCGQASPSAACATRSPCPWDALDLPCPAECKL